MQLTSFIQNIPNWPEPGIVFRDISPLLKDQIAFYQAIDKMYPARLLHELKPNAVDYWIGIESRGFIFATALAIKFGGGMVMMRKPGKLPPPILAHDYSLEYGTDALELAPGSGKVILVDDVLATGGTLKAAHHLCQMAGYEVLGASVLLDLIYVHQQSPFMLNDQIPVHTAISYEQAE